MNRREYLSRMATSAAGLALGAACRNVSEQQAKLAVTPTPTPIPKPETPRLWQDDWSNPFPTYPREQTIKLIFFGLAGITPNGDTCDVGFHSSGDNKHRHELSIFAFNIDRIGNCTSVYNSTSPKEQIAKLELKVDKPDDAFKKVRYFQRGKVQRRTELTDDRDFRWIIDFESDYAYRNFPGSAHPDKLPKVPHIYKPIINIPKGLFYTLRKTGSRFELKTTSGPFYRSELGSVADVIGANIYVEPNSSVKLFVNSNSRAVQVQAPGEIYFINTCTKNSNGDHCDAIPDSTNKEERGDFFLHYKAFDLEGKPEYELFSVDESHPSPADPDVVCALDLLRSHSLTDESPCAAVGYSGGS